MADDGVMGPISYLIVEFPGNKMTGEGFPILVDLVDKGLIRILDLTFVTKAEDGSMALIELADLDADGEIDLAVFAGAPSGLIDESDLPDASNVIDPGSSAGILLFENRWAVDFVEALRRGGAQLVSAGYIPQDAIAAAPRRDRRLNSRVRRKERTRTCRDSSVAWPGRRSSPEPRPLSPTASPDGRPAVGHNRKSSSTPSNSSTPSPPPAPAPAAPDPIAQLKEMAELHSQGILTDEEFAAQKAKILAT